MSRSFTLTTPLDRESLASLRAGDRVLLSGTVYAARDTAHRRIVESLDRGEEAPFPLAGSVVYYVGPTPSPPGRAIGSAGPTTACRMDAYAPRLYERGLAASIGKGKRSPELKDCLRRCGGVYLGATGGAAALLSRHITASELIAYPDLGPEAVRRLEFRDFPALVVYDIHGGDLFADVAAQGTRGQADWPPPTANSS